MRAAASEPFVLHRANGPRWVIQPPQDPYGDGYVYTVAIELHDDGMSASTTATIDGLYVNPDIGTLSQFVQSLADDWRGWREVRRRTSMEDELTLDAQHDGRAYVSIGVTLRAPGGSWEDARWSARSVFVLEAGEEMTRLAADLRHLLGS
ncbi:DUF6228 family protein [Micromonospora sp. NPDC049559]|uniref:DUF6228 family protein n=1 Tax=Micromonospora sp. NPDC049559 TaxID=3155923 RepID=UPI003422DF3E